MTSPVGHDNGRGAHYDIIMYNDIAKGLIYYVLQYPIMIFLFP